MNRPLVLGHLLLFVRNVQNVRKCTKRTEFAKSTNIRKWTIRTVCTKSTNVRNVQNLSKKLKTLDFATDQAIGVLGRISPRRNLYMTKSV